MACAPSEDSDQPRASAQSDRSLLSAWRKLGSLATHWAYIQPRLIRVFAWHNVILMVLSWGGSFLRKINRKFANTASFCFLASCWRFCHWCRLPDLYVSLVSCQKVSIFLRFYEKLYKGSRLVTGKYGTSIQFILINIKYGITTEAPVQCLLWITNIQWFTQ